MSELSGESRLFSSHDPYLMLENLAEFEPVDWWSNQSR